MIVPSDRRPLLHRMEGARRQTQRQLDMIDRRITRRMTSLIPQLGRKQTGYRRGKTADGGRFLEHYRTKLAGLCAERQSEIDALSRKLARQDAAIMAFRLRDGPVGAAAPHVLLCNPIRPALEAVMNWQPVERRF